MYLTLDTETIGVDEKYIYDVGWAVHDISGNIIHRERYLVDEIYSDNLLMDEAYYKCNIPFYKLLLHRGDVRKIPFSSIISILAETVAKYNVHTIMAYNLSFDLYAFYDTRKFIKTRERKPRDEDGNIIKPKKTFQQEKDEERSWNEFLKTYCNEQVFKAKMNYMCIYGLTTAKLLNCDEFVYEAEEHGWFTDKGNIKTGAEFAYRFLTGDPFYGEPHTALEDVLIEVELFAHCMKQPGEYNYEFSPDPPWKIVKARRDKMHLM